MLLKLNNVLHFSDNIDMVFTIIILQIIIIGCHYAGIRRFRKETVVYTVQLVDGTFGEVFVDKTGRVMAVIMPFISQGPSFSCKKLE